MIWPYSAAHTLLLDRPSNRHAWRRAWLLSGLTAVAALASLRVVAELSGQRWIILISVAVLAAVPLMIGVSLAVMGTGHARLWFLFIAAPPATLTAVLSGIGVVSPTAATLSWVVGVPMLLGMLLSSACAVWVFNQVGDLTRAHSRQRAAGLSAGLPVLRWQNQARLIRLTAAAGCALLAFAAPLLFRPIGRGFGIAAGAALLVCALACLRFEATLLCLARQPLVAFEGRGARVTYAGRWTLFAPTAALLPLMIDEQCAARASVALMALLREGGLGPAVRAASSRLTLDQAQRLSLSLSLQPGGAGAIRYLSTAFPEPIAPFASTYARLADEAAKPEDLQRWLAALTDHRGVVTLAETGLAPQLARMLAGASDALLRDSYAPTIEIAADGLQQTILALYGTMGRTPDAPASWPDALLARIAAHGRLLGTLRTAGADAADFRVTQK